MYCRTLIIISTLASIGACASEIKSDAELDLSSLALQEGSADRPGSPRHGEISLDEPVSAELTRQSPYHRWTLALDAAHEVFVDLASRAGDDMYLILFRRERGFWTPVGRNDDCYQGTLNACLEQELSAGEYMIVATTYDFLVHRQRPTVRYELRVSCRDCYVPEPDPSVCPIAEDPAVHYISDDPNECARIRFACEPGAAPFFSECGCGCIQSVEPSCEVGGCSGQLCHEPGESPVTTCEYRPEYACYSSVGTCERQVDGTCGWTQTEELLACLGGA